MQRTCVVKVVGWRTLGFLAVMIALSAGGMWSEARTFAQSAPEPTALALAPASTAAEAPSAAAKSSSAKDRKKPSTPRGRLPAYFGDVVSKEQREKIYAIQQEYTAKLAELRRQLDELTKERDAKIESLLTPEQRKKIADLKAAAKTSRDSKREGKGQKAADDAK